MASFTGDERIDKEAIRARYDLSTMKTVRHVTDFEMAMALGARAENLSRGWPTVLTAEQVAALGTSDEVAIAKEEYRTRKIPYFLKRRCTDGTFEVIDINDLERIER